VGPIRGDSLGGGYLDGAAGRDRDEVRRPVEGELYEEVVEVLEGDEDAVDALPGHPLPDVLVGEVLCSERVHTLQRPRQQVRAPGV